MDDQVGGFMADLGLDTSAFNRSLDKAFGDAQTKGERAGKAFAQGVMGAIAANIPGGSLLANVLGSGDILRVGAGAIVGTGLGRVASAASDAATELQSYRRSLIGISGDAEVAERALLSLQKIAGRSNFDTTQVLDLGTRLAGKSGDVNKAVGQVQNILDAATRFNVRPGDFEEFQKNLSDLQVKGASRVERPDVEQFFRRAPLAITEAAKLLGISNAEAEKRLRASTGEEFIEIVRKIGERNKGAAERAAGESPQSIARNIADTIGQAISPTGEIINRALTPIFQVGLDAVTLAANINRATGGAALLTVGLIATAGAARLVVPPIIGIVRGALTLGPSLVSLAGAATRAAVSLSLIAPGGAVATAGSVAAGAASSAAAATATVAGAGLMARFTAGLLPLLPALAAAAVAGIVAVGFHAIGNDLSGSKDAGVRRVGRGFAGAGTGAGVGAIVGGLLGSVIPGVGTAIGIAVGTGIGTVIGGGIGALSKDIKKSAEQKRREEERDSIRRAFNREPVKRDFFGFEVKGAEATKENTQAIKESTREFRDVKGFVFGGGDRTRGTTSQIELEYGMRGFVRGIV